MRISTQTPQRKNNYDILIILYNLSIINLFGQKKLS
ncbi:MAG: hypothetical protein KatS3mg034_2171 [Vicingaceae bacterium]|nr:MAG: hypothetical protein KatS3mg034_2171 [Vicingaceae bacterium]